MRQSGRELVAPPRGELGTTSSSSIFFEIALICAKLSRFVANISRSCGF